MANLTTEIEVSLKNVSVQTKKSKANVIKMYSVTEDFLYEQGCNSESFQG